MRQEVVPTQMHPSPVGFGLVDEICRLLGDDAVFRVHLVVACIIVLLYRPEGAKPHMKGHIGHA